MLQQMLYVIGGMKNPEKLGAILGAVIDRCHELGGPKPSVMLRELADHYQGEGK